MYLCPVHRYADEDDPCDECESDMPEKTGPSSNTFRERTYQEALALIERNCDAVLEIAAQHFMHCNYWGMPIGAPGCLCRRVSREQLWRQGSARD